ncbi:12704_t:CDS:2 [Entrophospora sp. SA101]|nr:2411_t:CDS:2 [Entrophospora sp. SA101]CAJ0642272.1 12704_t:CDS:2 [Entrophospora sp. SA101]CAJ0834052.1 15462_t:CDS:2 [Entrophospora sp. SA101]CAJ0874581.1 17192_t:CDS:2 [Entrophospora sp. SA101]
MANMDDLKLLPDDQEAREWIYKAKANGFMLFYDYNNDFENVELVENSADSILKKAKLRPLQKVVTLSRSKFNPQYSLRHVLLEVQKLRRVSAHDNVLSYIGLTLTQESNVDNIVTVVLDYADDNLRDYLSSSELSWDEKFKLAKQLTGGLYCIHQYDMFHGNLLHNFGKFKKIEESKKTLAQYFESIPYLDPQHLKNPKEFMRDEIISDIYSLGVLFWEISSQKIPFEEFSNEPCKLCYLIVYENHRENSVPDTPKFYEDLYKECWQFERDSRPKTGDVWEL